MTSGREMQSGVVNHCSYVIGYLCMSFCRIRPCVWLFWMASHWSHWKHLL